MAPLASDWLRHFRLLLWNCWTEFNETLTGSKILTSSTKFVFFGPTSEKQDCRPGLWLAETFSTSPLKPLNRIQRNLTGSKILMSSTKFAFFWADPKNKMAALASDWLRHFRLLLWNRWTEFNETWQEADLNVLYHVCVFRADPKNKMAALTSDWLRHFRLLLWNRWTEFNETWQEARSQRPLPSLCFSGRSENKMAALPSDWLRHFRLLLWNRWTEFNEIWQEERSRNVLYQVCVFRADQKNRMAALANPSKRWHIVLRCTICCPLGLLFITHTFILHQENCDINNFSCHLHFFWLGSFFSIFVSVCLSLMYR